MSGLSPLSIPFLRLLLSLPLPKSFSLARSLAPACIPTRHPPAAAALLLAPLDYHPQADSSRALSTFAISVCPSSLLPRSVSLRFCFLVPVTLSLSLPSSRSLFLLARSPLALPPLDPRHPAFVYLMPFHSLLVSRALLHFLISRMSHVYKLYLPTYRARFRAPAFL